MTASDAELSGYTALPEPDLLFAGDKTHRHPLLGLVKTGPYGLRFGTPIRLRLALMAPGRNLKTLTGLVGELERSPAPREAKNYYPEYPGFEEVFRSTNSSARPASYH